MSGEESRFLIDISQLNLPRSGGDLSDELRVVSAEAPFGRAGVYLELEHAAGRFKVLCTSRADGPDSFQATDKVALAIVGVAPEAAVAALRASAFLLDGVRLDFRENEAPPAASGSPFPERLPSTIALRDGMRVLDLGCGNGAALITFARWAKEAGVRVEGVGVDRNVNRADEMRRHAADTQVGDQIRFEVADVFELPAHLGRFDVVLCFGCFSYFVFESQPVSGEPPRAEQLVRDAAEVVPKRTSSGVRLRPGDRTRLASRPERLLRQWQTFMKPSATLLIRDLTPDVADEGHARGYDFLEEERWPLVSPGTLEAALTSTGFRDVAAATSCLRLPSLEEAQRLFGLGRHRKKVGGNFEIGMPEPKRPAQPDGEHAFSYYLMLARRGD